MALEAAAAARAAVVAGLDEAGVFAHGFRLGGGLDGAGAELSDVVDGCVGVPAGVDEVGGEDGSGASEAGGAGNYGRAFPGFDLLLDEGNDAVDLLYGGGGEVGHGVVEFLKAPGAGGDGVFLHTDNGGDVVAFPVNQMPPLGRPHGAGQRAVQYPAEIAKRVLHLTLPRGGQRVGAVRAVNWGYHITGARFAHGRGCLIRYFGMRRGGGG